MLELKEEKRERRGAGREFCYRCYNPKVICFCSLIQSFDPQVTVVILRHPHERKRAHTTGRMTHLFLKNSHFIDGIDFSENKMVNSLIEDEANSCFVLFPGRDALEVDEIKSGGRDFTKNSKDSKDSKKLVFFVLDGTWSTAKKIMKKSSNLQKLKKIALAPKVLSQYQIKRQPKDYCLSTIESVHYLIDCLQGKNIVELQTLNAHDVMIEGFKGMIAEVLKKKNDPMRIITHGKKTAF